MRQGGEAGIAEFTAAAEGEAGKQPSGRSSKQAAANRFLRTLATCVLRVCTQSYRMGNDAGAEMAHAHAHTLARAHMHTHA